MDLTFSDLFRALVIPCLCHLSFGFAIQSTAKIASPIEVKSIEVSKSSLGCTNVTLAFTAMSNVQVVWTIDKGIKPEDLSPNTMAHNHLITDGDSHASICLPTNIVFDKLILHLLCQMHSFELHLDMRIPQDTNNVHEILEQYDLLVPNANEIGVTSRGEARFPVMVNTSGTAYTFGLLQAEVTLLHGNFIRHDTAYSFLPINPNQIINVNKIASNGNENHFNIAIKSNILPKGETLLAVMAACSRPNSILERLDTKQEVLMSRRRGVNSGFDNSLKFIDGQQETIDVGKGKHTTLVCKTVGVTGPNTTLYKRTPTGVEPVSIPSYTTSLPHETTTVFQLLNVSVADSGVYICKVTKNQLSASKLFTVTVIA